MTSEIFAFSILVAAVFDFVTQLDWNFIITPIVYLIVDFIRKKIYNLNPKYLPYIAVLLGGVIQTISAYLTSTEINPLLGLLLGSLSISLYELKKSITDRKDTL